MAKPIVNTKSTASAKPAAAKPAPSKSTKPAPVEVAEDDGDGEGEGDGDGTEGDSGDDSADAADAGEDTGEDEAGASDTGPRTITAKRTDGRTVSVDYEFGDDIDEMIEKFGDKVVFNHARGSLTVALQGWMRLQLDNKKSPAEIKAAVKDWKPGIRRQGKTPIEKMRAQLSSLSAEDRAALLKDLKS